MPFLQKVKPLWERSTLTLADLAERCNISESSASRYLNGKIVPPADVAERIIQVLGVENPAADDTERTDTEEDQNMHQLIEHIKGIYQEQIVTLQTNFAGQLATMQKSHAAQVEDLRRDKIVLFITIALLVAFQVYLMIDGFHGNWGIFQYPVA